MNPNVSLKKSLLAVQTIVLVAFGVSLGACTIIPADDDGDIVITDDSCFSHCEARNESGCGLQLDCRAVCDQYEEMDCIGEVEDYEACRDDESDELCGAPPACEPEFNAMVACAEAYCEANPDVEGNIFCL